jgi:hypothetical protein
MGIRHQAIKEFLNAILGQSPTNADIDALVADIYHAAEVDPLINTSSDLIYSAWRDSEAYQIPMTDEGAKLADQRYSGFKQGWAYAKFHTQTNDIYMKDYIECYKGTDDVNSSE